MRRLSFSHWATLTLLMLGGVHAQDSRRVELILDVSGSMFGRLDGGQTRIAAAQAVLTDLIGRLPDDPGLNVGLRLYGARTSAGEAGACQDSELVLPLRGVDRAALLARVSGARPRGATPIAFSLQQAAADFPAGPGRNLIVLVTDGLESCGGDVKGALDAFKARGVEVDLRIIGIDLDARAQAAFGAVGTFVNARNAPELARALGQAVTPVAAPRDTRVPVQVTLTSGGQVVTGGPTVTFTPGVGGPGVPLTAQGGVYGASLLPGAYVATVQAAPGTQTFGGLTVQGSGENRFTFDLTPVGAVTLKVSPAQPVAGGRVRVEFSSAPAGSNWVTVTRVTDPETAYLDYARVSGPAGALDLTVPDDEQPLEARYHLVSPDGSSRVIGRSAPFTPRRAAATLSVPAQAVAGAAIQVQWTGPNNAGDYVTVVPVAAPDSQYAAYFYTRDANPGTLKTPLTPGPYEVRYNNADSTRVLARAPLTLTAGTYSVTGPDSAVGGSRIQVRWTGPNNAGDYVTVVPRGAPVGTYLSYFYTRDGNPGALSVPLNPGEYELRYSSEASSPNPTLASAPLRVTGAAYGLQAPASGPAGGRVQVRWTGPNNPGDYVTIVRVGAPVGAYLSYFYTRDGNPGTLQLPDAPGEYELRYSTEAASPNPTLFSVPFTVK